MNENWRDVLNFEGFYEVSDLGNVRSVKREVRRITRWGTVSKSVYTSQFIKRNLMTNGYYCVHLYKDGVRSAMSVHRVVIEAFVGPRPHRMEIMHLDDDKSNCALTNLKYGTRQENENHKVLQGRSLKGEKSPSAKLNKTQVLEIRARKGEPLEDLAFEYGCTFSNISAIQLRKSWKHL